MGNPEQTNKPETNTIKIGDIIPVKACQMIDVFYLVKIDNEKLPINKEGVVFLKSREDEQIAASEKKEDKLMKSLLSNGHYGKNGREEVVELTCQPGSEAYARA